MRSDPDCATKFGVFLGLLFRSTQVQVVSIRYWASSDKQYGLVQASNQGQTSIKKLFFN